MALDQNQWRGRRVFLTGHTGFKGAWLSLMLQQLGAKVFGYALDPNSTQGLYSVANLAENVEADIRADIRDLDSLERALNNFAPELILHLAAQPLVIDSYKSPLETYATNVMGTANLLDAARRVSSVRAIVVVTTDKCYENREWIYPYRETDALGGHDPYSSSKACAEIVASAYQRSFFFRSDGCSTAVATARAGNVIGGGDWSENRLIPDCIRAFSKGEILSLRFPGAVRPWQHVLDPLFGYLLLAEKMMDSQPHSFAGAWNFGPDLDGDANVAQIAKQIAALWGGSQRVEIADASLHEAQLLRLDISKARQELGWRPRWGIDRTLSETVKWYRAWLDGKDLLKLSQSQIAAYLAEES